MHILMVGPIGSGKSTQAKILSQELGLTLIQTGELVRKKSQEDSEEGRQVRETMEKGSLVSDEIMAQLLKEELAKDHAQSVLLDSYPRRLSQLDVYDPGIDKVVYLRLPDAVLEERLLARKRVDDKPEIIENRLKVYHEETEPLLDFYEKQGKLITIDGVGTLEEVTKRIEELLPEFRSLMSLS